MLSKPIFIAEAGVNHNGDISIAKKLIEYAKNADADYVKFQTFNADNLTTAEAGLADYQKKQSSDYSNQYEMLKKYELSKENHIDLINHCKKVGIKFLSTPFEVESLRLLIELNLDLIKISSGDLTNYFLLSEVAKSNLPIILSTGMGNSKEINDALNCLTENGLIKDKITLLHCTTEYPCPFDEVNLLAMQSMRDEFGVKVGYSDHTEGVATSIGAVALGACVIEKHFTLDRNMDGPDHSASLEPRELSFLVKRIRETASAIGTGIKSPTKSEVKNLKIARKSLVAKKDIRVGEKFSLENITAKRPGDGVSPMRFKEIINKTAKKKYKKDQQIKI